MKSLESHNLLLESLDDLARIDVFWQLAVLLGSLLLAWLVNRLLRRRPGLVAWMGELGTASLERLLFPLSSYLFVWLGGSVLSWFYRVTVLRLAGWLLLAMAAIRLAVYLLRYVFPRAAWVARSERYIAALIWAGFALHVTGVLPDVQQALDDFGFTLGKHRVSLWLLLTGLVSFAGTVIAAMWVGSVIEHRVMRTAELDMSLRVVITKLIRAALLVVGVLIALPLVGIDLTMLSVFGGAFGVGLGLGLQKIASNYVSGFVILLDRSIRLGDRVQIDNRIGEVTKLTARYVVVRLGDGSEAIIPNETLVTSTVLNLSYTSNDMRIVLPVQVSYHSDIDRVTASLLQAVEGNPRVLAEPAPAVLLKSFGESGIDLELAVWLADPQNGIAAFRSEINRRIWDNFRRDGIEIPYPQREVRAVS